MWLWDWCATVPLVIWSTGSKCRFLDKNSVRLLRNCEERKDRNLFYQVRTSNGTRWAQPRTAWLAAAIHVQKHIFDTFFTDTSAVSSTVSGWHSALCDDVRYGAIELNKTSRRIKALYDHWNILWWYRIFFMGKITHTIVEYRLG